MPTFCPRAKTNSGGQILNLYNFTRNALIIAALALWRNLSRDQTLERDSGASSRCESQQITEIPISAGTDTFFLQFLWLIYMLIVIEWFLVWLTFWIAFCSLLPIVYPLNL